MVRINSMQMLASRIQTAVARVTPVSADDSLLRASLGPVDILLPTALSLIIQLIFLLCRPALDGHEVLVAQTAREMVRNGDYLHPTFAGEPRWQKPPLAYWTVGGISLILGGISPVVARLPSAIATLGMTALVVLVTSRFASPSAARAAGLIHAVLPWTLLFGTSAMVDMTLSLLVASTIFLATAEPIPKHRRIIMAWSLGGLCVLAKGPIGPLVILGAIVPSLSSAMRWSIDRRSILAHAIGLVLGLLLAGAWPAAILLEDPAIARGWWEQSVGRFAEHWGEQTRPWYYYGYQVPALVGPALLLSILGVARRPDRLLLGWFGFTFILLSLSEGKRDHYVLPALVPCSVWAGLGWEYLSQRLQHRPWHLWFGIATAFVTLFVSAASLDMLPGQSDPMSPLERLAGRQQSTIRRAPSIAQLGSNNHATAFILDRPMRWYPDVKCWDEEGLREELVLVANRPFLLLPRTWRLVDEETSPNGQESYRLFEPEQPKTPSVTPTTSP